MTALASSNVPISGSERYLAVMLNGGWLTKWSDHPSKRCAATINVLHRAMKILEVRHRDLHEWLVHRQPLCEIMELVATPIMPGAPSLTANRYAKE